MATSIAGTVESDHQDLEAHFRALGVSSVATYKLWCYRNGLSSDLEKTVEQRRAEVDLYRESFETTRDPDVSERHNPKRAAYIARIFKGELQDVTLSDVVHRVRTMYNNLEGDADAQRALCRLVLHVEKYADLMRPAIAFKRLGHTTVNSCLAGLEQLARHHADWIRPVEGWRPNDHKPMRQFSSLARHLLAKYYVPTYFDSAFFQGTTEQARLEQDWFKHIGSGQNLRTARDLPMRVTKRMAHQLTSDDYWGTIPQTFRFVQYLTFGGSPRRGSWQIMDGPLGGFTDDEPFWETVVQFLASQAFLDGSYINPILDYIRNQKFAPQRIPQSDGSEVLGPPPHPSFCMKGRSISKLIREVDQWHIDLSGMEDIPLETWESCGLRELEHDVVDPEIKRNIRWSMHELTTSAQLQVEGRVMSHCVGSYVKQCVAGNESIWSLRALDLDAAEENQVQEHVLTVSVNPKRKLVTQYAGKHNLKPFGRKQVAKKRNASGIYLHLLRRSPTYLRMWMEREGLSYSSTTR